jgi:hypothetical protein
MSSNVPDAVTKTGGTVCAEPFRPSELSALGYQYFIYHMDDTVGGHDIGGRDVDAGHGKIRALDGR